MLIRLFLCLVFAGALSRTSAQTTLNPSTYVIINKITIEGNVKTKSRIITRELTFSVGDTILLQNFSDALETNRKRLASTGLFTLVVMNVKDWSPDNHATVAIKLVETWYLYPIPIFSLADRNFNVWWNEKHHALNRVNYGLQLLYYNFTGNRDPLGVTIQGGYTPKIALSYGLPFINRAQTLGFAANFNYSQNKEVNYATFHNKQLFVVDSVNLSPLLKQYNIDASLIYRPGLFTTQEINLSYHDRRIQDTIAASYNPEYFLDARSRQRYWSLAYGIAIDRRDLKFYPKKGYVFNAYAVKDGFLPTDNVDDLLVGVRAGKYFTLADRWSFETVEHVQTDLVRGTRPYNLNKALGYGTDYLRGYEYYVVDGIDFGLTKNTLRYEFYRSLLDLGRYMPVKAFRILPFSAYATLDGDLGGANNPYNNPAVNSFANRLLYSYGAGLNLVFAYDIVFKIEYSVNHLNEKGLYIHYSATF